MEAPADPVTSPPAPAPPRMSKRRRILLITIIVSITVITLILLAVLWLWRREDVSPTTSPTPQDELILASPEHIPPSTASPSPLPEKSTIEETLIVRVQYQAEQQPPLAIATILRSAIKPAPDLYAPLAGQPFSIVKILDANQQLLSEHRFTIPRALNAEYLSEDGNLTSTQQLLAEVEIDLLLPVTANSPPATIILTSQTGVEFDRREFVYENLVGERAPTPSPLSRLWRSFIKRASAQTTQASLVIIPLPQTPSSGPTAALNQARTMLRSLPPWTKFSGLVEAVAAPVAPDDLGCQTVEVSGRPLPSCPNAGRVLSYARLQAPTAELAIVVMPAPCYCGAAYLGSRIAAIGSQPSGTIVPHELGHAVGGLADEYVTPSGTGPTGPNCFNDTAACEAALEPFKGQPGARCSLECTNTQKFRPAPNHIMRNAESLYAYGPFQACVLQEALAGLLGRPFSPQDCQESSPTPTPTPSHVPAPTPSPTTAPSPTQGDYWGGIR